MEEERLNLWWRNGEQMRRTEVCMRNIGSMVTKSVAEAISVVWYGVCKQKLKSCLVKKRLLYMKSRKYLEKYLTTILASSYTIQAGAMCYNIKVEEKIIYSNFMPVWEGIEEKAENLREWQQEELKEKQHGCVKPNIWQQWRRRQKRRGRGRETSSWEREEKNDC